MYSPDQLSKIKSLVSSYFTDPEVKASLKSILKQEGLSIQDLDDAQLLDILKKANLMDRLLLDLERVNEVDQFNRNLKLQSRSKDKSDVLVRSRGLGLRIGDGKAFVEYVQGFDPGESFVIDLSFLQHRFRTQPVAVCPEPRFNEVLSGV